MLYPNMQAFSDARGWHSAQPVDLSDAVTADEIAVLGEDTSLRDKFTKRQW